MKAFIRGLLSIALLGVATGCPGAAPDTGVAVSPARPTPTPGAGTATASAEPSPSQTPAAPALAVEPADLALNAPYDNIGNASGNQTSSAQESAGYTTAAKVVVKDASGKLIPFDELEWITSNAAIAVVQDGNWVRAVDPASLGTVLLTARLRQDASKLATASVFVRNHGRVDAQLVGFPASAASLVVRAFDAQGRPALDAVWKKSESATLGLGSLTMPAGLYTFEYLAFAEESPGVASTPIAYGSDGSVMVASNRLTVLRKSLAGVLPTTTGLSASVGGPGTQITLDAVRYFNRVLTANDSFEVFFAYDGGSDVRTRVKAEATIQARRSLDPVTGFNRLLDPEGDKLLVTVPAGIAGPTQVWLKVNGMERNAGPFSVISRMTFDVNTIYRYTGESYNPLPEFKYYRLSDEGSGLAYPQLRWSSSDPSVGFATAGGTVYAYKPGVAVIMARTGTATASFQFVVTSRQGAATVSVGVPQGGKGDVETSIVIPPYGDPAENATVTP